MKANIRPALKKQIIEAAKGWLVALNAWTEAQAEKGAAKTADELAKANRSLYVWQSRSSETEGALVAFAQVFGPSAVADVILEDESITLVPSCVVTTKQAR